MIKEAKEMQNMSNMNKANSFAVYGPNDTSFRSKSAGFPLRTPTKGGARTPVKGNGRTPVRGSQG